MFIVGRAIHFSYGHRLVRHQGKCARLHGHNGKAVIEIAADSLDGQHMVMDFYEIQATIGTWIRDNLDHRMILSEDDPLTPMLREKKEGIVVLKEDPTAEVLARLIFQEARRLNLPVSRVTLWETENSFAAYHE